MSKEDFNPRADVYTRVTQKIIASLEQGVRPWTAPWQGNAHGSVSRPLRHNGQPYQGINVLLLWAEAVEKGYSAPLWMTYNQSQELGGQVRKGEKGSLVVFANRIEKTEEKDGEEVDRSFYFLKGYTVFNVEQIDGLPEQYYGRPPPSDVQAIDHAEQFVANTKADVQPGGDRACYVPSADIIRMPRIEAFKSAAGYYGVMMHELTHWTGHASRLNREFGKKAGEAYALEELCAELGSSFLCAELELEPEVRQDHADYIGEWLTALRNDKTAIFKAASAAQRAADYLHSLQPGGS